MVPWCILVLLVSIVSAASAVRPNVLLIITDDQGYGDLGFHGNPHLKTPHLDQLARESVRLKHFYVSPVCAPTRASLLTGRYNYRTGVVDTFLGRAMMFADEATLAERFAAAKYRTGIFGKWHLGDNYPMRPQDQGFQESLIHKGGGIGQPSDPPGGDSYFDSTLYRNGKTVRAKGYCTDVFTDAAMEFIRKRRSGPFFAWVAYNAPHTPLEAPSAELAAYRQLKLDDTTAKVYAMVSNIDQNVGRLLRLLSELKINDDTIVIFLTDNGPQQPRFNAGLMDRKGSVYDGGIRVPFFVRWPGRLQPGREIDQIAAHIDLAPTLLEACAIDTESRFDGRSLWPLLTGRDSEWPTRTLFFQWHRGAMPELNRAFAVREQRYKLVQPLGVAEKWAGKQTFKLFDMENDPHEQSDLAEQHPSVVNRLRSDYERWFGDMRSTRNFAAPRITVGDSRENPVVLTRQDWRGPRANWSTNGLGHWELDVQRAGKYNITAQFPALKNDANLQLKFGDESVATSAPKGAAQARFKVRLPQGRTDIQAQIHAGAAAPVGAHYLSISW